MPHILEMYDASKLDKQIFDHKRYSLDGILETKFLGFIQLVEL